MKELSIEEKAKRYDEALAKAAKIHRNYKGRVRAVDIVIEEVFPELKESEDERIRKRICKLLWDNAPYEEAQEYITWLEKQGEQKATIEMKTPEESLGIDSDTYNKIVDECIYDEQKSADVEEVNFFDDFRKTDSEVEPKFHEGDWIIFNGLILHIDEIVDGYYRTTSIGGIPNSYDWNIDNAARLWTVQDAKPGDVLCCKSGWTCIFKTLVNDETFSSYCFMDNTKWFCETGSECHTLKKEFVKAYNGKIYPATKEQRDLLFQKMKEAGYEWDTDKKELKKIEQKPAWSEEDELIIKRIDSLLYSINESEFEDIHAWLKSLRDRVQPQPKQEWSEEDEGYYDAIIAKLEVTREDALLTDNEMDFLKSLEKRILPKSTWNEENEKVIRCLEYTIRHFYVDENTIEWCCDWLKSLRPQNRWKPSEEQMIAIQDAMNIVGVLTITGSKINSLYQDLKKLI